MSPKNDRRAVTLSISMTPELYSEVTSRVESGLYTSASELLREALRLLIRVESNREAARVQSDEDAQSAARFAVASELMDLGLEMKAGRARPAVSKSSLSDLAAQLQELADSQESGPGLRVATDRLDELKLK